MFRNLFADVLEGRTFPERSVAAPALAAFSYRLDASTLNGALLPEVTRWRGSQASSHSEVE